MVGKKDAAVMKRSVSEFSFIRGRDPKPTVEVHVDSLSSAGFRLTAVVTSVLTDLAAKNTKTKATIYLYGTMSVTFNEQAWSEFLIVAGDEAVLKALGAAFLKLNGVRWRYGEFIPPSAGTRAFHLEDGVLWMPEDAATWYSEVRNVAGYIQKPTSESLDTGSENLGGERGIEADDHEVGGDAQAMPVIRTREPRTAETYADHDNGDSALFVFESRSCLGCANKAQSGSMTCEKCGKTFGSLCLDCMKNPCAKCGGHLAPTETVFPHTLFRAIKNGDESVVRSILNARKDDLNQLFTPSGDTALTLAALLDDKDVAQSICDILINHGASVGSKGKFGRTTLMRMVQVRPYSRSLASLFKESVNEQSSFGETALMFAAIGHGPMASRKGNISIAKNLMDLGAETNIADNNGRTALGHAIAANDKDSNNAMIEFLENAMKKETAWREFNERYRCAFTPCGTLTTTDRNPASLSTIAAQPNVGSSSVGSAPQRREGEQPSRIRIARSDASISRILTEIESVFGLPAGSVVLYTKRGRQLRDDETVSKLRQLWL